MIPGLVVLLTCQLIGEFLVELTGLPVPGPVVGMVVLLGVLQVWQPAPDSGLVRTMKGLLEHIQLLFVPAGAGVVQHLGLIGAAALPITVGLVASWLIALLVAAGVMLGLLAVGSRLRAGAGR